MRSDAHVPPYLKGSGSSSAVLDGFLYLNTTISGAHSGLSTCPSLTPLPTFSCLDSATQVGVEMWIGDLKSPSFSQVPLQFWDEHMAMLCLFEKALHHMSVQLLTLPRQKFFSCYCPFAD